MNKTVLIDFGVSSNFHTGIKTIDTFPDGSVLIVHKSGFREIFHPVQKIFVETA